MGIAGSDPRRNLEAVALLALFLSFATFSFVNLVTRPVACFPGDIGSAKCPVSSGAVSLGIWSNMPFNQTELMGNTSYRGLLITRSSQGASSISVGLEVGCINPSNTVGAILQLQYANYSDTTHTNTTNFVNVGISLPIDNSANNPCPGTLEANTGNLPSISANPVIYEFRVVGSGGGGSGDNPRFSAIGVYVVQVVQRGWAFRLSAISLTAFTEVAFLIPQFNVALSTAVTFDWIATNNGALVDSGTATCTIAAGASSCSVATTFGTPFVAVTPNVVCSSRSTPVAIVLPIGTISLLSAQTLTV